MHSQKYGHMETMFKRRSKCMNLYASCTLHGQVFTISNNFVIKIYKIISLMISDHSTSTVSGNMVSTYQLPCLSTLQSALHPISRRAVHNVICNRMRRLLIQLAHIAMPTTYSKY